MDPATAPGVNYRSCVDAICQTSGARRAVEDHQAADPGLAGTIAGRRGGIPGTDDRQIFAAIVLVLATCCTWRQLPPIFSRSSRNEHSSKEHLSTPSWVGYRSDLRHRRIRRAIRHGVIEYDTSPMANSASDSIALGTSPG